MVEGEQKWWIILISPWSFHGLGDVHHFQTDPKYRPVVSQEFYRTSWGVPVDFPKRISWHKTICKWRAFHICGKLIVVTLQEDIKNKTDLALGKVFSCMCAIIGEHAVKWWIGCWSGGMLVTDTLLNFGVSMYSSAPTLNFNIEFQRMKSALVI